MKNIDYKDISIDEMMFELKRENENSVEESVRGVIEYIRNAGDEAVIKYSQLFDGIEQDKSSLFWTKEQLEEYVLTIESNISNELKQAVKTAINNIEYFAKKSKPNDWLEKAPSGHMFGEKFNAIDSVACYIPGGSFPLASTVLHTVVVAKTVGVKNVIIVTPPNNDTLNPTIAYCALEAGADGVVFAGGAQAIAAVSYGTETIPKVDFICGPGNQYVSFAKKLVFGDVGIDMIAGPSEVFIVADDSANAYELACDLMAQAEHGSGFESSVIISTSEILLSKVIEEVKLLMANYENINNVVNVFDNYMFAIKVETIDEAIEIVNEYAPEHVEIITKNSKLDSKKVIRAGAVFVGKYSPEPIGDYIAGPSHVLPTNSTARFSSGISASTFMTRTSIIDVDVDSYTQLSENAKIFGDLEGLVGHSKSATSRYE